jgi:Fe-S cluster assembly protein SufD
MVGGKQLVDHHTRVDHAKPRCTSREFYRGVLDGAARGVFNGRVIVHQDAQHTDAQQANHNLLLSREAEVDTKPQLEIFADDVKCAHGATVGQLDDSMIFYLRSRGIEHDVAKALLIYAFAHDIVGRIGLEPLRHRIERHLISTLPEGERIKELV